jgi:hypothetical protein
MTCNPQSSTLDFYGLGCCPDALMKCELSIMYSYLVSIQYLYKTSKIMRHLYFYVSKRTSICDEVTHREDNEKQDEEPF